MLETIVRRRAVDADLPVCAQFWLDMFEEIGMIHRRDMASGWEGRFVEYLSRRIARREAQYALALDAGRIVGTAGALVLDGYPNVIHGVRVGYIFGVRVEPGYRGQGVATDLTQDAMAFLKSIGCNRIKLHASNAGRSIYEGLGFVASNEMQYHT